MKQFIYVFIALAFNSCVDQGSSDVEFTLFNQTDKTVKVLGFVTDFNNPVNSLKADPIIIEPNSSFKVTRITGIDSDTHMSFYSLRNGGVDSVRVIFDNLKVKTFGGINDDTPHDIFTGGDDNKSFITEQDYESAEDCNGNCE